MFGKLIMNVRQTLRKCAQASQEVGRKKNRPCGSPENRCASEVKTMPTFFKTMLMILKTMRIVFSTPPEPVFRQRPKMMWPETIVPACCRKHMGQ